MLTAEEIKKNWEDLIQVIEVSFSGDRKDKLLDMYNSLDQRIAEAPASGKVHYHCAYPGGYIEHVLHVVQIAPLVSDLWINFSGADKDYTDEELIFSTLNHDLGKLGSLDEPYFVQVNEDWKIKRGIVYEGNPKVDYMKTADRSLFFLQHFDIKTTESEYLAIKLHDGLYDESNKSYFISYLPQNNLRILPYIVHISDLFATKKEFQTWRNSTDGQTFLHGSVNTNVMRTKTSPKKLAETLSKNTNVEDFNTDAFDKIFGGLVKKDGE